MNFEYTKSLAAGNFEDLGAATCHTQFDDLLMDSKIKIYFNS